MPPVELLDGHKLKDVKENISRLVTDGKSESEARAISFRRARKSLTQRFTEGVEVFRAGNYPGKIPVSAADVKRIADTYNAYQAGRGPRYEAAAKFTHETGRPAVGWVSALKADGRSLIAQFRDPNDELLNGIIEETYPNPSIELRNSFQVDGKDQGLSLKSVAFLGADPPAVKEVAAFSEDGDGEKVIAFTFEEWNKQPGGPEMAEKEGEHTIKLEVSAAPPAKQEPKGETTFSESDVAALVTKAREEERKKAELEFAEQQAKAAEQARQADNLKFCDGLVAAKKLKPADRDFWAGVLNALTPELEFGEGKQAKPLADELRERMSKMPESGLFSELTPKGGEGLSDDGELHFGESTKAALAEIEAKYEKGKDSPQYKAALESAKRALQQVGG